MKKFISILSMAIMLFTFSACSEVAPETTDTLQKENTTTQLSAEKPDDKILIYLSGPEIMIDKLEQQFEEQNGDVCDFVKMSCGQLRSKVWSEKEAGEIQADVIWGSDPLIYNKLDDADLLKPLELKEMDKIDDKYIVKDKNYALVNERYVTIIYNNSLLDNNSIPKSYADLTDEKYNGIVVKADANQSSTAFAIASSLYQITGENPDYFQSLKNNNIMLAKSNGQVPSQIMEGQFTVGIAPHDGVVRLKNKGKKQGFDVPLEIVWPEEGVIGIQRPVAIINDSSRSEEKQEIASKLVNFLMSKKAQTITTNFGFASVRNDIENTFIPENVEIYSVDWENATQNEDTIKKEYQNIFHN